MHAKDAIRNTYEMSQLVLNSYVGDLSDSELLTRPGVGCNHIAWQLGHLLSSECMMLNSIVPGASIELPDGFAEKHSKENIASDVPADFLSREQYLAMFAKQKEATYAALEGLADEDLDKEGPEHMRSFCPTVGALLVLISTHVMMHVGQFVPVRRSLGKPVVI